ncbi:MAG: PDZ domain-containing protein [Ignavibacteriae bacterium]|nr:MAG: PDZ domain-containing protein [Ignavibacteriota bacterium]
MSTKSVLAAVFLISMGIIFGVVLVSSFKGVDFSFAGEDVKLGAQQTSVKPNSTLQALNEAFHNVGKTVTPSVVFVTVEMSGGQDSESDSQQDPGQFFHRFFGPDFKFDMPKRGPEVGSGSGVIITSNGYILTNNHVVANTKKNGIKVQLADTREFKAKLVGTDKYTDLAVIKIDAENLPVAALGNSDDVEVGHIVFAIGAPLGLKSTMTQGIVSALGRDIGIIGDEYRIENFIQTDAAVNPGNSGGPLVNINGEVIGINSAIATTNARYQGYSFAIPLNLAKRVATDIIKYGKFRRGFLGVQIKDVDAVYAKAAGLDKKRGVWVESVTKDAAGEKAGVEDGDIILSVDGKEVNTVQTLQTAIASKHPGESVSLQIWRHKKEITKNVTLGSRDEKEETVAVHDNNENNESDAAVESERAVEVKVIGVTVKPIDSKIKKRYDVDKGVLVAEIEDMSPAQERGLRKGDIVTDMGDQKVSTPDQFEKSIKKLKPGDAIMLRVKGENKVMRFVPIEIPK